ncbi:hypothetical protein BDZ97DRAFT_1916036 [Flammula alnicola]|nr:hypothetical protein BDZ97DRAFT_1916036 [Flammula alnicola]
MAEQPTNIHPEGHYPVSSTLFQGNAHISNTSNPYTSLRAPQNPYAAYVTPHFPTTPSTYYHQSIPTQWQGNTPQQPETARRPFPVLSHPPPLPQMPNLLRPTSKIQADLVCREFVMVENQVAVLQHQVQILISQNVWQQEEITRIQTETAQRIHELETRFNERVTLLAANRPTRDEASEGDDDEDSSLEGSRDEAEESRAAGKGKSYANHSIINMLVKETFHLFLGILVSSKKEHLPVFVAGLPEELPFIHGSKDVRQLRFNWEKGSKGPENALKLKVLSSHAMTHGRVMVTGVAPYLEHVTALELDRKMSAKYDSLRRTWQGKNGRRNTGGIKRDNRAHGKLEVRKRKREVLPAESEWKHAKYDAAFEYQQMSDDENTYDEQGKLLVDVYTSHAPGSRSEIYIKRVQGEVKEDQGPPATKALKGQARHWMVDPVWLTNHPSFDNERTVAENGKLWGDETNPEELEERSAQMIAEKKRRASGASAGGEKKKKAKKGKGKNRKQTERADGNNDDSDIYN